MSKGRKEGRKERGRVGRRERGREGRWEGGREVGREVEKGISLKGTR